MKPRIAMACVMAAGLSQPAWAQTAEEVTFAPGNFGTMISGTITGEEYRDYRLRAGAGQEMFVEIDVTGGDGQGTAYLNILPPGSDDVAIYIGSMDIDNAEVVALPESGTYTIRVYLMGNDRDAGKTVAYNIDVSIQ